MNQKYLLQYNQIMIPCDILYSKRKTISITVSAEHGVAVRAPLRAAKNDVHKFIREKANWIYENWKNAEEDRKQGIKIEEEASMPFYGELLILHIVENTDSTYVIVRKENECLFVQSPLIKADYLQPYLEQWYRKAAKKLILERAAYFAAMMQVAYGTISIRNQKTRWGSCSSRGNLNFNWKLLLMPREVLDYVIVHELAHIKEMNHSKVFWGVVEQILPDYKKRKKWLNENGCKMKFFTKESN